MKNNNCVYKSEDCTKCSSIKEEGGKCERCGKSNKIGALGVEYHMCAPKEKVEEAREDWKANWKDTFALHLGQYADHERLHEEPFVTWAIKFIEAQKQEAVEEYEAYLGCIGEDIGNILAIEPKNWKQLLGNITTQIAVIINPTPQ